MVLSAYPCRSNSYPLRPRRVTWINAKREGVKSKHFGAHKLYRLGLSCKANKCSDTGTGDLGVLTAHEISPYVSLGVAGSTVPHYDYPKHRKGTLYRPLNQSQLTREENIHINSPFQLTEVDFKCHCRHKKRLDFNRKLTGLPLLTNQGE